MEVVIPHTNHPARLPGPQLHLGRRKPASPRCRDEILAALQQLIPETGQDVFTSADVAALHTAGSKYTREGIKTTIRAMKRSDPLTGRIDLFAVGRVGFRLGSQEGR